MPLRKSATRMSLSERENFLYALLTMKNTIANPGEPDPARRISIYDQFVALHFYGLKMLAPPHPGLPAAGVSINVAHGSPGFGPWHREYLRRFELALQAALLTPPGPPHPGVEIALPYWDWTDHTGTISVIFSDPLMGPNGGGAAPGAGGGNVLTGYFAADPPGTGTNAGFAAAAGVLPPGWAGWKIRSDLAQGSGSPSLRRFLGAPGALATQADVLGTLSLYSTYATFRPQLESGTRMHGAHHIWIGSAAGNGHMYNINASPNDPMFFLHHCQVDRLWAMWQEDGHWDPNSTAAATNYPISGELFGHNLADPLWPWVGAATPTWSSQNAQPAVVLPDFSAEPVRHPGDLLDHRAVAPVYDTEVVVGVALDQTGSMTGMTPDPMTTGGPDVSKWVAAQRGVSALLQDCEAAYTAGEAYITAGVETFRALVANVFTQVFGGTGYGLVKNGSAFSRTTFDTNIALFAPGGGTPLADALTDTENSLRTRPVFGNQPAGENRYLLILTDGISTAGSPLSSLGTPAFPDTVVFAMGFGVGSGWDGVDYATIATLVSKGRPAPPGVPQVYHGENAGTIDKFYGQSLAASIGYVPSVDPVFELLTGEHVDVGFAATDADRSFLITGQGFDFNDQNWRFCLITPTGETCTCDTDCEAADSHGAAHHDHGASLAPIPTPMYRHLHGPFLVTSTKSNGRITIFLNRNGADSSDWVGQWYLRAMYRMADDDMIMFMPSVWDIVRPVGAPPVRGPLYARTLAAPTKRVPSRLVATPAPAQVSFIAGSPGTSSLDEGACEVAVNVYARTTVTATLGTNVDRPFAGEAFQVVLELDGPAGASFRDVNVLARLVGPAHSIGNAFADPDAIPFRARRRYLDPNNATAPFNQLRFLADYERKRPGTFAVRDEEVVFRQEGDARYVAEVKDTRYPGVYRVAASVGGTVVIGEGGPQTFGRVLQTELALGLLPDPERSRPILQWVDPNRFVVRVTPMDRFGNVASPVGPAPTVLVEGVPVAAVASNPFTGEYRLVVSLRGDVAPSDDGAMIERGSGVLEAIDGGEVVLGPGSRLNVSVLVAGNEIPARIPPLVIDRRSGSRHPAGSQEAMSIPIQNKVTYEEATSAADEEKSPEGRRQRARRGRSPRGAKSE